MSTSKDVIALKFVQRRKDYRNPIIPSLYVITKDGFCGGRGRGRGGFGGTKSG